MSSCGPTASAGRQGEPAREVLGDALRREFNKTQRSGPTPAALSSAIGWIESNAPAIAVLAEPAAFRELIGRIERRQDGKRAAPNTIRLRRTTLRSALDYAVELKLVETNHVGSIKVERHNAGIQEVDRRSLVNPTQARALLDAVTARSPRLTAFFGAMYYAALRPEEAVNLRRADLALPAAGWGELHLRRAGSCPGVDRQRNGGRGTRAET